MRRFLLGTTLVAGVGLGSPALAAASTALLPSRAGQTFSGSVRDVGDGDSLCVGATANPATWIEVRLADFDAPELHESEGSTGKALLERLTLGRPVSCRAVRGRSGRVQVYDRVIAVCTIGGRPIGALLRAAGAPQGGR